MARINIEDKIFTDRRFTKLVIKCGGDEDKAIGAVVRSWFLAQQYWKKDKSLIPAHKWDQQELPRAIIEVGLAEEKDHGIYVKGAAMEFDWLLKRREAGRKGGRVSKKADKVGQKSETSDSSNLGVSKLKQNKQTQASFSYSLSNSKKKNKSFTKVKESETSSDGPKKKKVNKPSQLGLDTNRVVAYYCDLWKYKHGRSPAIKGKDVGTLKSLVRDMGATRVAELLKGFFSIPDSYYVFSGYSVQIFYNNIARIDAYLATGRNITKTKAREVDQEIEAAQSVDDWRPQLQLEGGQNG